MQFGAFLSDPATEQLLSLATSLALCLACAVGSCSLSILLPLRLAGGFVRAGIQIPERMFLALDPHPVSFRNPLIWAAAVALSALALWRFEAGAGLVGGGLAGAGLAGVGLAGGDVVASDSIPFGPSQLFYWLAAMLIGAIVLSDGRTFLVPRRLAVATLLACLSYRYATIGEIAETLRLLAAALSVQAVAEAGFRLWKGRRLLYGGDHWLCLILVAAAGTPQTLFDAALPALVVALAISAAVWPRLPTWRGARDAVPGGIPFGIVALLVL